jgi:carboxylesterase type B
VQSKASSNAIGQTMIDGLCPGAADPIACVREKTFYELANWGLDQGAFGPGWSPTEEGSGGVLPDTTERLFATAEELVPLIVGTNKNEWGLYQFLGWTTPTGIADFKSTIEFEFGALSDLVEAQYPVENDAEANDVYVRLVTDVSFRCPARSVARCHRKRRTRAHVQLRTEHRPPLARARLHVRRFGVHVLRRSASPREPRLRSCHVIGHASR